MADDPPITQFYLVRHAPVVNVPEGIYSDPDLPADLSDAQALEFTAALLPPGAQWWTSPLARAVQTAKAMIDIVEPGSLLEVDKRLEEQNFGQWHGLEFRDLWPIISELPAHNWSYLAAETLPPDGDTFTELFQRIEAFVADLLARRPGENHILICHAGVIRAVTGLALGLDADKSLQFALAPLSVTHLIHRRGDGLGGDWQLAYLNRGPVGPDRTS